MASLRDIRKRIRSVKSTQQITKAMKMVSAAKLRRAQDAIVAARPYARSLDQMIADLVSRSEGLSHPLLTSRPVRRVEILALTSDRGLAGGFNANVIRRVARYAYERDRSTSLRLTTVGRKGLEAFRRRHLEIRKDHAGLYARLSYETARALAEEMTAEFLEDRVDQALLVYNEFVSAITQRVVLTPLLPFERPATEEGQPTGLRSLIDFEYEPSKQAVLDKLVPQAVATRVYRALLESVASEHGARMSAMENATSNAEDAISRLTLTYNRTRQAVITKELMEIVSGAEALK
ncbi:MAG TPA: ATP synthase F1 subunit gamma [Myxococcaceae bacterium]|nr:ATP synthase F1 subunit gamma [Myxococcaceae bacterium]